MLYYIILSVIILICILLTIVVLLQPGQGSGLSGGLAGGSMTGGGGLGARRTADLLSKSTSVLGGALLVLCVLANFAIDRGGGTAPAVQQGGTQQPIEQQESPAAIPDPVDNPDDNGDDGGN